MTMEIDRRSALSALAGAGALIAATPGSAATAPAKGGFDLSDPANRMRAFRLLRGGLDQRLTVSWISARYYGVVDDRMDPLFAVVSAVFARSRPRPDGGFAMVTFELAWFTDARTGTVLDTLRNPYTGQDVKVPSGGYAPSRIHYGPDLSFALARPIPGLEMEHEILPFEGSGDDVWVIERSRTALTPPGAPRPFRYSESNTLRTSRRALARPGATRVTGDVAYTSVCSWRPWLQMGDRPGHLTASGVGRVNDVTANLPPAWLEATAARRPEVLKDPDAILAPLWNQA